MPRPATIDRTILEAALIGLEHQKSEIDGKVNEIRRRLRGMSPAKATAAAAPAKPKRKRKLSAAARKRIAEATKKRWAEYRAKKAAGAKK